MEEYDTEDNLFVGGIEGGNRGCEMVSGNVAGGLGASSTGAGGNRAGDTRVGNSEASGSGVGDSDRLNQDRQAASPCREDEAEAPRQSAIRHDTITKRNTRRRMERLHRNVQNRAQ